MLSPIVFNIIYAEKIIRVPLGERIEGVKINVTVRNNVRYAETNKHLQTLMNLLVEFSSNKGLSTNTQSTTISR